ncbi:MAG: hypothetical protein HY680_08875 [Chloroflexi bacterium]|nr:hypothetical protein [Chloroflexota bacterium]
MDATKIGIYFSAKENKIVRITSPYWIPEPPEWVMVTSEANATLLKVREMIKEKKLVSDPSGITWGSLPIRE